jgi:hypothetical protein
LRYSFDRLVHPAGCEHPQLTVFVSEGEVPSVCTGADLDESPHMHVEVGRTGLRDARPTLTFDTFKFVEPAITDWLVQACASTLFLTLATEEGATLAEFFIDSVEAREVLDEFTEHAAAQMVVEVLVEELIHE